MKIALCLIVKNEEAYIAEWLAYHRLMGVDAFLVYDNMSTDGTAAVIAEAQASGLVDVRLIPWDRTDPFYQVRAYDDAVARFRDEFDWIGFIDADEFVATDLDETIPDLLARHADASAVALNWAVFGSSGHEDKAAGLTLETYTHRAPEQWGPNGHTKMFVRPKLTQNAMNPHFFFSDGVHVHADGEPVQWAINAVSSRVTIHPWRINHYFTRSRAEWNAKVRRGYHDCERLESVFLDYDRNDVEDLTMLRHAPAVRALANRLGGG